MGGSPIHRRRALLVAYCLLVAGALGVPSGTYGITYGPSVKGLGPEQTVFDHEDEATGEYIDACEQWDIPDQPARAFKDDKGRVHLHFDIATNTVYRNVGSSLDDASKSIEAGQGSRHDCSHGVAISGGNTDPSKFDDYEWLTSFYTFDGQTIYSLSHDEWRGWQAQQPWFCPLPANGDTTKCWYNALVLYTSTNSGDWFDRYPCCPPPTHLVAGVPYQWVNQTGPYGVFSPSNIIRKQPDDGYLYVIVRAKEPGKSDVSCVMRTQATSQALGDPASWRAWGDGPDAGATDSFEVQFVNPYTYNFTASDTPAMHMCKDIGGGAVTGVSESLTYNTYFGKYMLVGGFGGSTPGFYYSLSDNLVNWSAPQLLIGLTTQQSWRRGPPCDPDPARDPSLLDPSSPTRNFETTGRQVYAYYKIFRLNGGCTLGPNRDLLRVPIELEGGAANVPPAASFTASPGTVLTGDAVSFDGSASTDPDGSITGITDYKWDLDGNGTFETDTGGAATTSRSYSAGGTVTVGLRVTDSDGATNDTSRIVTVNNRSSSGSSTALPNSTPTAKLSCATLKKKRAAVTRRLRAARRKLARSHSSAAKRRYRKQIKSLSKRLKRLRRTPCRR